MKDDLLQHWRAQTTQGQLRFKDSAGRDVALPFSFRGLAQALDALAKSWAARAGSQKRCEGAFAGQQRDDDPGRQSPDGQQQKSAKRQREIARDQDGAGPDGVVQGSAENADHRRIGALHGGPRQWASPQAMPERQHAIDQQHPGRNSPTSAIPAPATPLGAGPIMAPR